MRSGGILQALEFPFIKCWESGGSKAAAFLVMIYAYAHLRQFECRPETRDLPSDLLVLYRIACIDAHGDKVPLQF